MRGIILSAVMLVASASSVTAKDDVWLLYRSGFLDPNMKIHMATFDSEEGGGVAGDLNGSLCELTARLMRICHRTGVVDCPGQESFKVRYWCERKKKGWFE